MNTIPNERRINRLHAHGRAPACRTHPKAQRRGLLAMVTSRRRTWACAKQYG